MVYSISFVMPYEQSPSTAFLDGDLRKIDLVGPDNNEKKILKIINKHLLFLLGMEIELENQPTKWHWNSTRPLPDCNKPEAFPLIPEKMKSIIEEFEPEVHQFFPVQVVDKKKQPLARRWLWNVCNRINSVDPDHTTYVWREGGAWVHPNGVEDSDLPAGYDRGVDAKLVFSNERVGGAHCWRDPNLLAQRLYCSQAVGDTLLAEGFTGLELSEVESV